MVICEWARRAALPNYVRLATSELGPNDSLWTVCPVESGDDMIIRLSVERRHFARGMAYEQWRTVSRDLTVADKEAHNVRSHLDIVQVGSIERERLESELAEKAERVVVLTARLKELAAKHKVQPDDEQSWTFPFIAPEGGIDIAHLCL